MQILIASVTVIVLSLLIQVTKIAPTKKIALLDLFLLLIGGLATYSEMNAGSNQFGLGLQERFSKVYTTEAIDLPGILAKNAITIKPQFTMLYGIPKDGISTTLKALVTKQVKEGQKAIYIELKAEILSFEQALGLFGTQNLHELVHFTQGVTLVAVDDLHLSISNGICHVCKVLTTLHKGNQTMIVSAIKNIALLPQLIDEHMAVFMSIKQYVQPMGSHYRFDWAQEATTNGQSYQQYCNQKMRDLARNLSDQERDTLLSIKKESKDGDAAINSITTDYGVLQSLIDKNLIIAKQGRVSVYDQFVSDAIV